jgi:hypothetical protein
MERRTPPSGKPHGLITRLMERVRLWLRRRTRKEEPNIYPFF